jgi:hypothetical protein
MFWESGILPLADGLTGRCIRTREQLKIPIPMQTRTQKSKNAKFKAKPAA